jgi:hypothetical protein
MRKLTLVALAGLGLTLGGCGGSTKPPAEPTEEQKKKVAEEDKRVEDEESQGHAGKKKAGKR